MAAQVADRVRIVLCKECQAYHVFLFCDDSEQPYAAATLTTGLIQNLITADSGAVVEHHPPLARLN